MQKQYRCVCVCVCVCVRQKKKTNKQRARSMCVCLFVCLYVCVCVCQAERNANTHCYTLRTCLTVSSIRCATTLCYSALLLRLALLCLLLLRLRRRRRRRWRQRRRPGTNKTHSKFVSAQKFSASSLIVQRLATVSRVASANKKLGQRSRQRRQRQRRWQQRERRAAASVEGASKQVALSAAAGRERALLLFVSRGVASLCVRVCVCALAN